jgi:heme-degrading monooxygenase HmoA
VTRFRRDTLTLDDRAAALGDGKDPLVVNIGTTRNFDQDARPDAVDTGTSTKEPPGEMRMIVRLWRGWAASTAAADSYQEFLRSKFLPGIHSLPGYRGASVLRRTVGNEIEFVTLTRFESVEAIRGFAGEDYEAAHVAPEARALLSRFDARCQHFEWAVEDKP